ncbi:hypothetical protein ACNKHU_24945 [Shigella flexneri]
MDWLCGELGAEVPCRRRWSVSGLDELSTSAPSIPAAKAKGATIAVSAATRQPGTGPPYFAGSGTSAAHPHDPTGRTVGHRRAHHAGKDGRSKEEVLKA